jgi:hypothetical protein
LDDGTFAAEQSWNPADDYPETSGQIVDEQAGTVRVNLRDFCLVDAVYADYRNAFERQSHLLTTPGAAVPVRSKVDGEGLRTKRGTLTIACPKGPEEGQEECTLAPRGGPTKIVIHATSSGNPDKSFSQELSTAISRRTSAFAHYYIDRNGEIFQLVDDNLRALHVGMKGFNADAVGIELFNNVGEPYDGRQIASLIRLIDFLATRYSIARPVRDSATGLTRHNAATDKIVLHGDVQSPQAISEAGPSASGVEPRCDPIGTFSSSADLQTVTDPNANPDAPCVYPTTPIPGNSAYPALADVVLDAIAVGNRTAGSQHTGVINTSGGDAFGRASSGKAGSVEFSVDSLAVSSGVGAGELTTVESRKILFVPAGGAPVNLTPGQVYTDVFISGDLNVSSTAQLLATGTIYLSPTGRIILNPSQSGDANSLRILVRGMPHLQGLIDATGTHGVVQIGSDSPGGKGGSIDVRTSAGQLLFLPTVVARGGNANSNDLPLIGIGATGGDVTVRWDQGHVFVGGGAGPLSKPPYFRVRLDGSSPTPPSYIGFELLDFPYNGTSGHDDDVSTIRRILLRALTPQQVGFTRGILTTGGMGAHGGGGMPGGTVGGAGGAGGSVSFAVASGLLTFRDADITTGADVEAVQADVFLEDRARHFYWSASGSLGGTGETNGGIGGQAGSIRVSGYTLAPAPNSFGSLASIIGFGGPGSPPTPSVTDVELDPAFTLGTVIQASYIAPPVVIGPQLPPQVLYRLRLDNESKAAGGSGGVPIAPALFAGSAGHFGSQGSGGAISGLPSH